jgi:hypothetical protein
VWQQGQDRLKNEACLVCKRNSLGKKPQDVVHLAQEAHVKQLFLFHHDPAATDEHLN